MRNSETQNTWALRAAILEGIANAPVCFTEDDLRSLVGRVAAAGPERPVMYAYTAGRNWAISRRRKADVDVRRELRRVHNQIADEREERFSLRCKAELLGHLAFLRSARPSAAKQLDAVHMAYVQQMKDPQMAEHWPGTTRDQRYQWKHRGLKLVLAREVSDRLRKFLGRKMKGRPNG